MQVNIKTNKYKYRVNIRNQVIIKKQVNINQIQ